jgi:hypothetical protein
MRESMGWRRELGVPPFRRTDFVLVNRAKHLEPTVLGEFAATQIMDANPIAP